MPFTAGVYAAPLSPGAFNTAVTGSPATPAAWNALLTDLTTALSTCVLKDGTQIITQNIPMASKKFTGLAAGTALTDSANLGQVQNNGLAFALDVSVSADVLLLTLSPVPVAYVAGMRVSFVVNIQNTGATTVNVNGLGVRALQWPSLAALAAGDLRVDAETVIEFNVETNTFQLMSVADPVTAHTFDTKGDTLVSLGSTVTDFPVGANGTVAMARSAVTRGLAYVAPFGSIIYGLTYQNNAGDATNDLDIAAGGCMDATNAYFITETALTKRSDATFVVGTNQGMLDTGAVGDSDYYLWAIARSDTGVCDILCSLSSTAPTMPASYDFKRLIGWFRRTGGTIVAFKTYDGPGGSLELLWTTPPLSVNSSLSNVRRTDAIAVPQNISVEARVNVSISDGAAPAIAWVCCPDQTDQAPGAATTAPLANLNLPTAGETAYAQLDIKTSATGTIAARGSVTGIDTYAVVTIGFKMARR